jgi:hypothetical protein
MEDPNSPFATSYSPGSAVMRALGLDIDRIQRLARRHEQSVALLAAEAEIGAGFGQTNLTDAIAIGAKVASRGIKPLPKGSRHC